MPDSNCPRLSRWAPACESSLPTSRGSVYASTRGALSAFRVLDLHHLHHLPIGAFHVQLVLVMRAVGFGDHFLALHRLAGHRIHEAAVEGQDVSVGGAFGL